MVKFGEYHPRNYLKNGMKETKEPRMEATEEEWLIQGEWEEAEGEKREEEQGVRILEGEDSGLQERETSIREELVTQMEEQEVEGQGQRRGQEEE